MVSHGSVWVERAVVGKIRKKIKDVTGVDVPDELQIHVFDVDGFQIRVHGHIVAHQFDEAQKEPQVQIIF